MTTLWVAVVGAVVGGVAIGACGAATATPGAPSNQGAGGVACSDDTCALGEVCDECGSSSCPECDDCVAACVPPRAGLTPIVSDACGTCAAGTHCYDCATSSCAECEDCVAGCVPD